MVSLSLDLFIIPWYNAFVRRLPVGQMRDKTGKGNENFTEVRDLRLQGLGGWNHGILDFPEERKNSDAAQTLYDSGK